MVTPDILIVVGVFKYRLQSCGSANWIHGMNGTGAKNIRSSFKSPRSTCNSIIHIIHDIHSPTDDFAISALPTSFAHGSTDPFETLLTVVMSVWR
jgi:hypothetical protein